MKRATILFYFALAVTGVQAQTAEETWVQRYSNDTKSSDDRAASVVADSAGDVIVAGYTDEGVTGKDILVIKYSNAGVPLWTNRYNGPANANDVTQAAAVDSSGNVFVTGYSTAANGFFDYVTIAFSGAGVPLWTNRYNGSGNLTDDAFAVAVDVTGDVIVTGQSWSGNSDDYVTIKYSGAGVPLWTNRYDGPGNGYDFANAIAVDSNGSVFVTGQSVGLGATYDYDYATIAYSGAGVPLWTNRYNGPNVTDVATAITVDNTDNLIVTGHSSGSGNDYLTIKYSGAGVPLWTNRYNATGSSDDATAVAADAVGNVFVTGQSLSGGIRGYLTIAYSSAGVSLWTNRYNGSGINSASANGLAIDFNGNVFVTGSSPGSGSSFEYATIAYSGGGVPLWTNRYNGSGNSASAHGLAIDSNGNIFVTGRSLGTVTSYDFATIKYSSAGLPVWTNSYNGSRNGNCQASAVAVDGGGNVFVAGSSVGIGSSQDYVTIKYSGSGVGLWTNRYNGAGNNSDSANSMAMDADGNVFVTGTSVGGGNFDYATVAYSNDGVPQWTNRYNGPGNSTDDAKAVAVDINGNVFVTGNSVGSGTSADYATVAYSGAGVPLWTNRYNGPGNFTDQPSGVAVDTSGTVIVTGYSLGGASYSDYLTIAYSGTGVPLWTNHYNGPGNQYDTANAIAVDGSGTVFVTGSSTGTNGYSDYATIAYSNAGVPLWTNRYSGLGNAFNQANAIAVDGNGNVFVTGRSKGSASYDYATIKYSGAGVPLWTNRYNGPANRDDQASSIAVDGSGNVVLTGYSIGNGTTNDYATIAYSNAGMPLWTNRYNGPVNGDDQPQTKSSLAVGPDGSAYVTGSSSENVSGGAVYDITTVKYSVPSIRLSIARTNNQVVVGWTKSGFVLQSAPAASGTFTNIPGATSPYTNSITGAQKFFRLISN